MPRLDITGNNAFEQEIYMTENEPVSIGRAPENTLVEGGNALFPKRC